MARPANNCGVSPALAAPGCVEVLAAAPRLRLRASPCQLTPTTRRPAHTVHEADH
jgi:hypothetical protein